MPLWAIAKSPKKPRASIMGAMMLGDVTAAFEGIVQGSPLIETDQQVADRAAALEAAAALEKEAAEKAACMVKDLVVACTEDELRMCIRALAHGHGGCLAGLLYQQLGHHLSLGVLLLLHPHSAL